MTRPLVLVIIALTSATAAACSSDDGTRSVAPTSRVSTPTTTATSAPDASDRADKRTAGSVPANCPAQPDSTRGSPAPAQGSALTDGMYFGYITALDAEDLKLTFDAAQLLTGDAAAAAAAQEGSEESDYWIRNNSRATRTLELAEDAVLCTPDPDNPVENRQGSLSQLNQTLGDGEPMSVWIDVRSGVVTRVQHQFFP